MSPSIRMLIVVCAFAMFAASACAQETKEPKVRRCARAGQWFPADADALKAEVKKFLDAAKVELPGEVVAVVAPHAGYAYSGGTAGYAFKGVEGKSFSRVIVMAPSHFARFRGASIADADFYETPLGRIPVDRAACDALLKNDLFQTVWNAHVPEHAVEAELPFLQVALKEGWMLVPMLLSEVRDDDVSKLAEALGKIVGPDTLIVVSNDFTHYGDRFAFNPFKGDYKENIRKLDQGAVDKALALDPKGFRAYCAKTGATICGRDGISLLLAMLEGRRDIKGVLTYYASSGDVTGVYADSVSYASVVFCKVPVKEEAAGEDEKLTGAQQATLLKIARAQLEKVVRERDVIDPKDYGWDLDKKLLSHGAVFVTLTTDGDLRGCIGDIIARQPLYLSVLHNTTNAAARDPRFAGNRITAEELSNVRIEISYLTPMKKVDGHKDIVIGRHGILLEKAGRRAVFLPQVATEQRWDLATTLQHLSMKAGLPQDAWKEACTFHVFEAQVFHEKKKEE